MTIQQIENILEKIVDGNITISSTKENNKNRILIIAVTPKGDKKLMDEVTDKEVLEFILEDALSEWALVSANAANCIRSNNTEEEFNNMIKDWN